MLNAPKRYRETLETAGQFQ